ncbi:MAG TPA: hypothetical protein VIK76_02290 [Pyrinomonadaceae bacterium]|jgi:hypothetical protein
MPIPQKFLSRLGDRKLSFSVEVNNERLELTFKEAASRIADFRNFWVNYWGPQFFSDIRANFASQGGSVGGWRALSPEYAAWKRSVVGNKPILQFTGEMLASFTIGDRNNIFRAMKTRVVAGSRVKRVSYHNEGGGRLPKRQIIFIGPKRVYQPLLNRWVAEEMAAAGMPNVRRAS